MCPVLYVSVVCQNLGAGVDQTIHSHQTATKKTPTISPFMLRCLGVFAGYAVIRVRVRR